MSVAKDDAAREKLEKHTARLKDRHGQQNCNPFREDAPPAHAVPPERCNLAEKQQKPKYNSNSRASTQATTTASRSAHVYLDVLSGKMNGMAFGCAVLPAPAAAHLPPRKADLVFVRPKVARPLGEQHGRHPVHVAQRDHHGGPGCARGGGWVGKSEGTSNIE